MNSNKGKRKAFAKQSIEMKILPKNTFYLKVLFLKRNFKQTRLLSL
jgi:hypothetical protein